MLPLCGLAMQLLSDCSFTWHIFYTRGQHFKGVPVCDHNKVVKLLWFGTKGHSPHFKCFWLLVRKLSKAVSHIWILFLNNNQFVKSFIIYSILSSVVLYSWIKLTEKHCLSALPLCIFMTIYVYLGFFLKININTHIPTHNNAMEN